MTSRIYYMMLAVITAACLAACDNTGTTEGAGSSGGVGTENMQSGPAANDTNTESYPESEIPPADMSQPDAGTTDNTDPNATQTNP